MNTNTNEVYALKSMNLADTAQEGFLLFPNQIKAQGFLDMCGTMSEKKRGGSYRDHGVVQVVDFVYGRVQSNGNYFIRQLEW